MGVSSGTPKLAEPHRSIKTDHHAPHAEKAPRQQKPQPQQGQGFIEPGNGIARNGGKGHHHQGGGADKPRGNRRVSDHQAAHDAYCGA